MFVKRSLLASSALMVLASAGQAHAGDFYVGMFGGANWHGNDKSGFQSGPPAITFGTTGYTLDSDSGFVMGGVLGTHLDRWVNGLRIELEAAYRRNDVNGTWFVTTNSTTQAGIVDANQSSFSVMANVWYDIDVGLRWRPYLGGGVGWARSNADGAFLTTTANGGSPPYGHAFDVDESGFAWQLGAGLKYDVGEGAHLGIGYRYFRGPDVKNDVFLGKHNLPVNFEDQNHSVTVDLTVDVD